MSRSTNPETESSVTCGFFNGTMALSRKYDALQMSSLFDGILTDGVFSSIGECFGAVANTTKVNTVNIGPGKAWFNRTWTQNDALLPIDCGGSTTGLDRIDAIVIEVNTNDNVLDNFIYVIKGNPSSNPSRPSMVRTDKVNQYALCYIYRKADSANIVDADITNVVGTSETPFATGVMQTASIDALYAAWGDQFQTWFDDIKTTLTNGDVASNLKYQLDYVKDNAVAKTSNFVKVAEFKTAGTYVWTPGKNDRLVRFVIMGGGEGGSSGSKNGGGSGGCGGEVVITDILSITPDKPIHIVVGEGGSGAYISSDNVSHYSEPGGSSSCMGIVACGGDFSYTTDPHKVLYSDLRRGTFRAKAAFGDCYLDLDLLTVSPRTSLGKRYYGGVCGAGASGSVADSGMSSVAQLPSAPFDYFSAGGGGGGFCNTEADASIMEGAPGGVTSLGSGGRGATASVLTADDTAPKGEDGANGCGGGGGAGITDEGGLTLTYKHYGAGGRGGDGYVGIYVLKGDINYENS